MPGAELKGTWQSVGHGWIMEIGDGMVSFYDITDISCLPSRKASLEELIPSLGLDADTLYLKRGILTYRFVRLDKLPDRCSEPVTIADDPTYNFDVFAQTVSEHYVFSELNRVNWDSIRRAQGRKLTPTSADTTLYRVLEETLNLLRDNHAYLEATEEVHTKLSETSTPESGFTETAMEPEEYGDFEVAALAARHHLETELTRDSWLIQWGWMADSTAYVQIKAMWLFADLQIPERLIEENGFVDAYADTFQEMEEGRYILEEVAGVRKIMKRVMKDLGDAARMVLDIRFNGGGQDAVSFEILRHFNDQRRLVALEQVKSGDSLSPLQPLYLETSEYPFTNPVYVLTSGQTGSAAESLVLASLSLPHVKRIGTPSSGALSTALEKSLPNGWQFSISNELFMDTDGVFYENRGIPVEYNLGYPEERQSFFRKVVDHLDLDEARILQAITHLEHQGR